MLVVNIFGAPNSGKSTLASDLFIHYKGMHLKVENIQEVVKIAHYENDAAFLKNDLRILAEKNRILDALNDAGVDIAIMDGPVLNSMVYKFGKYLEHFDPLVLDIHHSFNNLNLYIPGVRNFSPVGRYEKNPEEALARGDQVLRMLDNNNIEYSSIIPGSAKENSIELIGNFLEKSNRNRFNM